MLNVARALAPDGPIAGAVEDYRERPQQVEMANAVDDAIAGREILVCEAGTGTGKTLAYLVPAVLSGKTVVVSTGTRNLQEQLYHRDLPAVVRSLGVRCDTALLKGRGNYLCLHRLARGLAAGDRLAPREQSDLQSIRAWAARTATGDIAECVDVPEHAPVWREATSTADNCLGQDCPRHGECHVVAVRRKALAADVVVVNHHLFFADLALRVEGFGELLPGADAVVLDEAHQVPEIAARFFGETVTSGGIADLARDTGAALQAEAPDQPDLAAAAARLPERARHLHASLREAGAARTPWAPLAANPRVAGAWAALSAGLAELEAGLHAAAERGPSLASCHQRSAAMAARLERLSGRDDGEWVRWVECTGGGFSWHATPLEVGPLLAAHLDTGSRAWIFTSATLAVRGDLGHFAHALGLRDYRAAVWDSPFDFRRQALCLLPDGLPDPRSGDYTDALVDTVLPILEASRGRAFMLFTSHRAVAAAARRLEADGGFALLVQGTAPRSDLLRRFAGTARAVLLGTSSFWEGVDVRGEALSCVIIDKLPFASPADPVLAARVALLRERGEDPFVAHQLPQAVIALKQGVGRLIRDAADRGVVVLCDPRIRTRGYGAVFLDSLPDMTVTHSVAEACAFFAPEPAW